MSRQEQDALVAYLNAFKLSKKITAFEQLSDGKALMEVMSSIDSTHFKHVPTRGLGISSTASSSSENWVLRMNTLKRLYRLLLSFPLPPPHAQSLALSTLPEPPFSTIAKSSKTAEGTKGLIQICRLCLAVGVWGPGNEKVISKIQRLKEEHMAELMKSIEEVMASLPVDEETQEERRSPLKVSLDLSSPPSGWRSERDKLLQDNDELREQCEELKTQVAQLTSIIDDISGERDDALHRLNNTSGSAATLRTSQTAATAEVDSLRGDLAKADENLARTEEDLQKQVTLVADLTKTVEDLKVQAAEAAKLKDQLDEYRHTAERLQKSENVIEKYKRKLEESAGLRRELRSLEEENTALINTNASLEADLKRAGTAKVLLDNYKEQIATLEKRTEDQAEEITTLNHQLELAQNQLDDLGREYERDQDELQLQQEKLQEIELGVAPGLKRKQSTLSTLGTKSTLDDELGGLADDGDGGRSATKTDLRLRIRALQRELADLKVGGRDGDRVAALETLLADAKKARDRYQSEYLEAHRNALKLQATLEQIRSVRGGDNAQTAAALKQRLDEVLEERDALLLEKQSLEVAREEVEKKLKVAETDLSLVGKDEKDAISALRSSIQSDVQALEANVRDLKEQIGVLKDKDRQHLLLMDKVDLQSSGINQRERALEKEKEFSELRTQLAAKGVPPEAQQHVVDLHEDNTQLTKEVKELDEKLEKAKAFIRDQDAMFKADHAKSGTGASARTFEAEIIKLKEQLEKTRQSSSAIEKRYKQEQQLMLSAWHELGSRTVRDHMTQAGVRRSQPKPAPTSWLGRQRRVQEDASFVR
nr:uncharacterized protein CI109_004608 [Kwoniella shandongensis]KAA5527073.1 hypothetical protein CI109_004608 [Kwoniella shandongensis]